jgi:hypothetical protein
MQREYAIPQYPLNQKIASLKNDEEYLQPEMRPAKNIVELFKKTKTRN